MSWASLLQPALLLLLLQVSLVLVLLPPFFLMFLLLPFRRHYRVHHPDVQEPSVVWCAPPPAPTLPVA